MIHNGREVDRHFWSPQLVMDVEGADGNPKQSVVRCLFGPQPAVWTGFAAFYALGIFVAIVGGCWGAAQASLELDPHAFWFCGVGSVAFALSYVVAWQGQRLGRQEMLDLRAGVDRRLKGLGVRDNDSD